MNALKSQYISQYVQTTVTQTGPRATRKVRMESSGGVLQDLAKREQVLSGKVQAARDQVASLIAEAESKAKAILAKADADAKTLESEYRVKREAEEKSILETSLSGARAAAESASSAAQAKVADAVKLVISKVIP